MADGELQLKMECFFPKEVRPGRRRRRKNGNAGRPRKPPRPEKELQAEARARAEKAVAVQAELDLSKQKEARATTSDVRVHKRLAEAIDKWFGMTEAARGATSKGKWVESHAKAAGVSPSCLRSYIHPDPKRRKVLPAEGKSRRGGSNAHVAETDRRAIQDTIASADLGNEGMSTKQCIEVVQAVCPKLTATQARSAWFNTVRPEGHKKGVLTKGTVKAQATTSQRSMITERQQRRWYDNVSYCLRLQAERNLPRAAFQQAQASFVANYDEECFQAQGSEVKIVGAAAARKHEAIGGGRTTITTLKCGLADGQTGPVIFLMNGKEKKPGFDDETLVKTYGLPAGSTVMMTESGFMTDEAFDLAAPKLAAGIRALRVVRDHPDWWLLLSGDGFHAHKFTLAAQALFHELKMLHQIEEGDSSHVNQAFDRDVAKFGKATARETLPIVIRHKVFGPSEHLDQWALLVIAAHAVRELAKEPDIWVRSFKATNMHPDFRLSFDDWMIKISDFVTRGGKYEDEGEISAASLLPDWYRNWPDSRKQAAKKLIDEKGWGCVEVLRELCELTSLTPADVAKYQTCYFVECRRGEAACTDPPQRPTSGKVVVDPNRSLLSFQLKPEGLKGLELFKHLCRFRSRRDDPPKMKYDLGGDYLDLDIKQEQFALLQPTAADLSIGQIMRDCASSSASQKMPERKLNVLGEINAYSVMANDPERMARMKSHLELAATINSYKHQKAAEATAKHAEKDKALKEKHLAPALAKLAKLGSCTHDNVKKLTVSEMEAVLLDRLGTRVKTGMPKAQVVDLFVNKAAGVSWEAPAAPAAATADEHAPQASPSTTSNAGAVEQ